MRKQLTPIFVLITLIFVSYALLNHILGAYLSEPRLKKMIVEPIEEVLGREIEVSAIEVSLLKGIRFSRITIQGLSAKQNLGSIDEINISYDFFLLLKKRLVITSVDIQSPRLNLTRDITGFNIHPIEPDPKNEKEPDYDMEPVEPLPLDLILDSITITDGVVSLKDKTGKLPAVEALAEASLSVTLGKPLAETTVSGTASIQANSTYKHSKPVLILDTTFSRKSLSFAGSLSIAFDQFFLQGRIEKYLTEPKITLICNSPKINIDNMRDLFHNDGGQPDTTTKETISTERKDIHPPPFIQKSAEGEQPADQPGEFDKMTPGSTPPVVTAAADSPPTLSLMGEFSVTELRGKAIKADNIKLSYTVKEQSIFINDFAAEIFGGKVGGNISLQMNDKPAPIEVDISTQDIRIEELLKASNMPTTSLSGKLTTHFTLTGKFLDWPPYLRETLNGKGEYKLSEGSTHSPLSTSLATLLEMPELKTLEYNVLSGAFDFVDGDLLLNVSLHGPQYDIESYGTIGRHDELNMPLALYLSSEYSRKLAENPRFSKYQSDEQGRISLRLTVAGRTNEPDIWLDENNSDTQDKQGEITEGEESPPAFLTSNPG